MRISNLHVCDPILSVWGSQSCWLLGSAGSCELMELPAKAKAALPMHSWEWRARERLRVGCSPCFFQLFWAGMQLGSVFSKSFVWKWEEEQWNLTHFASFYSHSAIRFLVVVGCNYVSRDGKAGLQEMQEIPFPPTVKSPADQKVPPCS